MSLDAIIDQFRNEHDLIGLWQLVREVKDAHPSLTSEERKIICLRLIKQMLSEGFEAGSPPYNANGYSKWQNQEPESVVKRISEEWELLNQDPNIPDIVWFKPPNLNN